MNKLLYVLIYSPDGFIDSEKVLQIFGNEKEINSEYCTDYEKIKNELAVRRWDILICEYKPSETDIDFIVKLVRRASVKLPILCVTGTLNNSQLVKLVKSGVDNVVTSDDMSNAPALVTQLLSGMDLDVMRYIKEEQSKKDGKKYHSIFNNSPTALMLLDETGFFDCNSAALQLFNFSNKIEFLELHPSEISPETQLSGESSFRLAEKKINQALSQGQCSFEWIHRKKTGEDFYARVNLSSFKHENRKVVLCSVEDITHENELHMTQLRRERLLKGISTISEILLSNGWEEEALKKILEIMLEITGMSRVYIVRNHFGELGEIYMDRYMESSAPEVEGIISNPYFYMIPFGLFGYEWITRFEDNHIININEDTMSDMEKEFFNDMGVRTCIMIPLFSDGKWNGFIGIDDVNTKRTCSAAEIEIFKVLGNISSSGLNSSRIKSDLDKTESTLTELLGAMGDGVKIINTAGDVVYINEKGRKYSGIESILSNSELKLTEGESIQKTIGDKGSYFQVTTQGVKDYIISFIRDITKEHQETLQKNEYQKQLEILLSESAIELWELFENSVLHFFGNSHTSFLTSTDVTFEELRKIIHHEDYDNFKENAQEYLKTGTIDITYRALNSRGEYRYIWSCGKKYKFTDKARYLGFSTDISSRVTVENRLKASLKLVSEITENIDEVFIIFASGGDEILYSSSGIKLLFPEEIKSIYDLKNLLAQSEQELFFRAFNDASREKVTVASFEISGEKKRWFRVKFIRSMDEDGRVIAVLEDQTEKHESDIALMLSEEKYRNLIETNPDEILRIENSGSVVFSTLGNCHLPCGIEDLCNYSSITSDGCIIFKKSFNDVLKTGNIISFRSWGNSEVIEWRLVPEFEKNGGVDFVTAIGRNITSEESLKNEIEKLNKQFLNSQKMDTIGALASGIAHDFNNLLTCIHGNAQLALMDMGNTVNISESIDEIKKSTECASALVRRLISSGKTVKPEMEQFDLSVTVRHVFQMLSRILGERIKILVNTKDEVKIFGDSLQLEQVFINLALNARDSMPSGGELTVSLELLESYEFEGARLNGVKISVSDTGYGIDSDKLERIFEPFYSVDNKSAGLGLFSVKNIIKLHHGVIDVQSVVGKGSSFYIYLPLSYHSIGSSEDGISENSTKHILIIEDEYIVSQITRRILEKNGFKVTAVRDGFSAAKFLEETKRVDLALCDVVLPDLDGYEVYTKLQKIQPDIRFLFTSGYAEEISAIREILDSGHDFIPKPYSSDNLLMKISELID
ncbi:MAG: response regulator [Deltaproteobacteria bacterium]|nr:response regulator [Deltaproteobacteria bacterium]